MAKQFTIHFKDVGREKRTWDHEADKITEAVLTRAVHEKRAIASREPEFMLDEDGNGKIFCWFHTCGTFTIQVNGPLKVTA